MRRFVCASIYMPKNPTNSIQVLPIRTCRSEKSTARSGDEVSPAAFDTGALELGLAPDRFCPFMTGANHPDAGHNAS
jgi:hypothetical protein